MAEVVQEIELSNGKKFRKIRIGENQERWQNPNNKNRFYSENAVMQIVEQTNRQAIRNGNPENQARYTVAPESQRDKQSAIESRYSEWNNAKGGLNVDVYDPQEPKENRIKGWMKNNGVIQQVENDPLLQNESQAVKDRAIEAKAREIVKELENVANEKEAKEVIRRYGLDNTS